MFPLTARQVIDPPSGPRHYVSGRVLAAWAARRGEFINSGAGGGQYGGGFRQDHRILQRRRRWRGARDAGQGQGRSHDRRGQDELQFHGGSSRPKSLVARGLPLRTAAFKEEDVSSDIAYSDSPAASEGLSPLAVVLDVGGEADRTGAGHKRHGSLGLDPAPSPDHVDCAQGQHTVSEIAHVREVKVEYLPGVRDVGK